MISTQTNGLIICGIVIQEIFVVICIPLSISTASLDVHYGSGGNEGANNMPPSKVAMST